MRRRTGLILLVLVLLGAAVNFPVAVLCDKSRTKMSRVRPTENLNGAAAAARSWPVGTPHETAWPAIETWQEARAFGYRCIDARAGTTPAGTNGPSMQLQLMGWPWPCVARVHMWWDWNDPKLATTKESDPRAFLWWQGVILNPLAFAFSLWLVLVAPVELWVARRQLSRFRRRACTRCGYPAGVGPVCTECGARLPEEYAAGNPPPAPSQGEGVKVPA